MSTNDIDYYLRPGLAVEIINVERGAEDLTAYKF